MAGMNAAVELFRYLCFCVFFSAGAGAMMLAILVEPELMNYYLSRQALAAVHAQNEQIKELTDQYTAQIQLIQQEPAVLERIRPLALNQPIWRPDTAFPRASQTLRQQADALFAQLQQRQNRAPDLPVWLQRCVQPKIRQALFLSGGGLVLMTFIFFGGSASATAPTAETESPKSRKPAKPR